MATNTAKKKKKKGGKPDYFFIGLLAIVAFVGVYMLFTWDWPSHKREDLIGKWYYDTSSVSIAESDGNYKEVASTYWTFGEDGSFTLTNASTGTESTGTFSVEDKTLTITFSGSDPEDFPFVIKGTTLSLDEGDDAVVLSRVQ